MAIANRTIARSQAKPVASPLRMAPLLAAAGLALVAIAVLQLYQTSRATTASFRMQQLQEQKLQLDTSVRQLEADVAGLSSLTRIEQEAARLGLQPATARGSVEVNVAPPEEGLGLPTRYEPNTEEAKVGGHDASWWQKLRRLSPF